MKKIVITLLLALNLLILLTTSAYACTTIIVGKDASSDGSAYFGRCNDSPELMNVIFKSVPASNESGNYVYEDEGTKLKLELPKKCYQYFYTPEKGVVSKGEWGQVGFLMNINIHKKAKNMEI